ncbi:hypothetical protein OA84_06845 [Kaistella solincola]|uniref:Uncharacterized protein n=1 Tax=Kaistella solincola TaxID=510955 RepID=A0ABR4ZQD4_9FLAO|nr:hypothetical protein [Kaistella solincola]KIA83257.1 hypothetical protein OA84_06845 [Kaistella solincola]
MHHDETKKTIESDVKKQNQDFPNIPASSEKVKSEETVKKEVKEGSKLNPDGKTDNTEKNREK